MINEALEKIRGEVKNIKTSFKTKGSFTRNFSYLFSGRVITTLLSFAVTPILTRLYSPEAYGYFAFFNAVALNFALVSSLGYENALIIVKGEKKFYNLFLLCIISITVLSLFFGGILVLLNTFPSLQSIVGIKQDLNLDYTIFLLFGSFVYSIVSLQPKWNVRRKQFKYAASVSLSVQILNRATALTLGIFAQAPVYGLVISELISKIGGGILNTFKNLYKEWNLFIKNISISRVKKFLKEEIEFPKYYLPSRYIALTTNQIPVIAGGFFFGAEEIGSYALSMSLLILPMTLLGNTLSPIILKKFADSTEDLVGLKDFSQRMLNFLFFISAPFFILLFFISEIVFPFVFGAGWELAGLIAKIVSFYLIVDFVQIFSNPIYTVFKKQKSLLIQNILRFIISTIFLIPGIINESFTLMLFGYGISYYVFGWFKISMAIKELNLSVRNYYLWYSLIFILVFSLEKFHLFVK